MNITFRQLRVFTEVARHNSVQRASEALHLTPQAVSMQLREIESQVGLRLFDRQGRGLSLSMAGEQFLMQARRMLSLLKETQDLMARYKQVESGRLSIGMLGPAKYFLPTLLARFRAEHPGVQVTLRLGNRAQLVAAMQAREVDMAVMGRAPADWPNRAEPFAMHPQVLVTAPDHPFTALAHVPVAALARETLIVREAGSGTRAAMEEFLRAHHVQPLSLMEIPSDEAIKQAVMAGLGVSLLSRHTVALELQHGLIATPPMEGLPLLRRWHLVRSSGTELSPAAEAFRYFLLESGRGVLAELVGEISGGTETVEEAD
ncbi:LysR substrate-binding domain-containing protein [Ideonella alba]|uniref:LysR family transcriptional regulator n=1 Tax=Ideonella alba TaxID=2824118 RepID=A0A941BGL7_9BURK|nr:LysR substrate-binding domain-containing protein [Ideonella alba]MBQ0933151.1 LysR family transcriptional regulator [Ideonella alba]